LISNGLHEGFAVLAERMRGGGEKRREVDSLFSSEELNAISTIDRMQGTEC